MCTRFGVFTACPIISSAAGSLRSGGTGPAGAIVDGLAAIMTLVRRLASPPPAPGEGPAGRIAGSAIRAPAAMATLNTLLPAAAASPAAVLLLIALTPASRASRAAGPRLQGSRPRIAAARAEARCPGRQHRGPPASRPVRHAVNGCCRAACAFMPACRSSSSAVSGSAMNMGGRPALTSPQHCISRSHCHCLTPCSRP